MKRIIPLLSVMVLLLGLTVMPVWAVDVEVTAAVDFNTAYVWRGMTFNDGLVAQPSIDVTKGGFGINVWGNFDIDDYDDTLDSSEFSEIDLTLSYGFTVGKFEVTVGFIEYVFPTTEAGGAEGTREIYLSLGTELPAGFSVALDIYYDMDEVTDYYSVLGLTYACEINAKTNLGIGGSAAYAGEAYSGDGDAGFYDYALSVSLDYAINDAWSVAAGITYVDAMDDDKLVEEDKGGPLDVNTYGSISIAYAF
jgi:hypothetical protein